MPSHPPKILSWKIIRMDVAGVQFVLLVSPLILYSLNSVRNCCVMEVFGGVFVFSRCFLDFPVGVGGYCHETE